MENLIAIEYTMEQVAEAYSRISTVGIYHIFIGLVIFDIITGIVKGFVNKEANSTKGLFGIIKHLLVVVLVLTTAPYLVLLGLQPVAVSFIGFFIAQYGISFVENWAQIGLPMPTMVSKYFEKVNRETNEVDLSQVKITIDTPKKEDDI